jgi:hypothetical protein
LVVGTATRESFHYFDRHKYWICFERQEGLPQGIWQLPGTPTINKNLPEELLHTTGAK